MNMRKARRDLAEWRAVEDDRRDAELAVLRADVEVLRVEVLIATARTELVGPLPTMLDVEQAAQFIGCSTRTLKRYVAAKAVPCVHVGRGTQRKHVRFARESLEAWLRSGARRPGTSRLHSERKGRR